MQNSTIPDWIVPETDPSVIRQFSMRPMSLDEFDDQICRVRKEEKNSPENARRCKWGRTHLARFISRYVHFYKQKPSDNRTFILQQLEDLAKENNITLPTEAEMKKRTPKKRLVCEYIDVNRASDVVRPYKLYYDGEHFVASLPGENKAIREQYERTKWDDLFDGLYMLLKTSDEYKDRFDETNKSYEEKLVIRSDLESELIRQFYEVYDYDDAREKEPCPVFIGRKLWNMTSAYNERRKRFHRKKDQVRWTAWWTITYSDENFADEQTFRRVLLNKFRNLCYRKKWLIMGVFEHGEDNGRLHFHGFFYIPQGQEIGELVDRQHYSKKRGCLEKYKENTEFARLFGANQYVNLEYSTDAGVNAYAEYTSKMLGYMEKGEKVYYSRHIPTEFTVMLSEKDMLTWFSITCKRQIKRYVVASEVLARDNLNIYRAAPLPERKEKNGS